MNVLNIKQNETLIKYRKSNDVTHCFNIIKGILSSDDIIALGLDYDPNQEYFGIEIEYLEGNEVNSKLLTANLDTKNESEIKELLNLIA